MRTKNFVDNTNSQRMPSEFIAGHKQNDQLSEPKVYSIDSVRDRSIRFYSRVNTASPCFQRGLVASISLILPLLVVVLIITACGQSSPSPSKDSASIPGSPLCNRNDLNDPVISACLKTLSTFPRRDKQQIVDSTYNNAVTSTSEYESNDRWQIEWQDESGEKNMEVTIGPLIYIKDRNGEWQTVPLAARQAQIAALVEKSGVMTETIVNVSTQVAGTEEVNGVLTTIYESVINLRVDGQISSTAWIGNDGLIYKQIIQDPAQASTTTTVYEYDSTIKVEAPDAVRQ